MSDDSDIILTPAVTEADKQLVERNAELEERQSKSQGLLNAALREAEYGNLEYIIGDGDKWDDRTFLDRAKLTYDGKITRTTLLLVGKEESAYFLEHISQLVWVLLMLLLLL